MLRPKFTAALLVTILVGYDGLLAGNLQEKLGIGFSLTSQKLFGDTRDGKFVFGGNPISLRYAILPHAYLETDIGFSQLTTQINGSALNTDMIQMGFKLGYRFQDDKNLNPIVYLGLGALNFRLGNGPRYWDAYGAVGGGAEWFFRSNIGLNITGDVRYTSGDDFDGSRGGGHHDAYLNFAVGLNYYLGGRRSSFAKGEQSESQENEPLAFTEVREPEAVSDELAATPPRDLNTPALETENLVYSITQRDRAIRLLRAKLKILERQRWFLEGQLGPSGVSDARPSPVDQRTDQLKRRLQAALGYFSEEKYEDAVLSLKSILNERPGGPIATTCWHWLGESYYNTGQYLAAINAFEQASKHIPVGSPKSQMSKIMLGLSRWQYGAIAQATTDFQGILTNNPDGELGPLVTEYLNELRMTDVMNSTH